jgi:hypothetical protein
MYTPNQVQQTQKLTASKKLRNKLCGKLMSYELEKVAIALLLLLSFLYFHPYFMVVIVVVVVVVVAVFIVVVAMIFR